MTSKAKIVKMLQLVLDHLPDNVTHDEDKSWEWCWDELSGDAQDEVKKIRKEATEMIAELIREIES